jgi:hypothetical protein
MNFRLLRFLALSVVANQATVTGIRRPLGYQQITVLTSSTALTLPAVIAGYNVGYVVIQNSGSAAVRWRDDGVAPTAGVGMTIPVGGELDYVGDFKALRFIQVGATGTLDVSYYAP